MSSHAAQQQLLLLCRRLLLLLSLRSSSGGPHDGANTADGSQLGLAPNRAHRKRSPPELPLPRRHTDGDNMAKRSKPPIKRARGKRRQHEKEGKPLLPSGSSAGSAQSQPKPAQEAAAAAAAPATAATSAARAPKAPSLVVDSDLPPPVQHISELPDRLQTFLADRSLAAPTEVQRRCWPACLAGRDLVCVAPTGSGKTLGYVLPLLERLRTARAAAQRPAAGRPVALVLVPTRELAQQVAAACAPMLRLFGIRVEAVHGGDESRPRQLARLRGESPPPALLVATPGRLLDLATEGGGHEGGGDGDGGDGGGDGVLDLSGVEYFVMDEADKMLTGGLLEQAEPRRTPRRNPSLSAPSLRTLSLRTLSLHPPSAPSLCNLPSAPSLRRWSS